MKEIVVFKLGGSLLKVPNIGKRLRDVLNLRRDQNHLIVVGGGAAADVVRAWSQTHNLSEEDAHWLAIRSLALNRALIRQLLPETEEVASLESAQHIWARCKATLLLDVEQTLQGAEGQFAECDESVELLPHSWNVTSDSIAAWVACQWNASELILLKSVELPETTEFSEAAAKDFVDGHFPNIAPQIGKIGWCNLRSECPTILNWIK